MEREVLVERISELIANQFAANVPNGSALQGLQ